MEIGQSVIFIERHDVAHFVLGVRFHEIVTQKKQRICASCSVNVKTQEPADRCITRLVFRCKREDSGICGAFLRGVWILPLVIN